MLSASPGELDQLGLWHASCGGQRQRVFELFAGRGSGLVGIVDGVERGRDGGASFVWCGHRPMLCHFPLAYMTCHATRGRPTLVGMTQTASTYTATGDLSSVGDLADTQLAIELAAARTRFAAARVNDPRRTSLAYTDAKLAVSVFTDETNRRAAGGITVVADQPALRVETNPARQCGIECTGAAGTEVCTCECGGRNHGLLHRARPASTPASQARAWARIPEPWGGDPV